MMQHFYKKSLVIDAKTGKKTNVDVPANKVESLDDLPSYSDRLGDVWEVGSKLFQAEEDGWVMI